MPGARKDVCSCLRSRPARQTLKSNYQQLKLRPETDFDRILLETVGFSKKETVKETETEKGELDFCK